MRLAALYDIHGNLPALEAVLVEINREQVDALVVGGDVVAGPLPAETLDLLQSLTLPTHFIHGNAESELLRYVAGQAPGGLSAVADREARWVAQTLKPEQIAFVSDWSSTIELTIGGLGTVLFCHATPHNDIDVFTRLTPDAKVASHFENLAADMVICGHTHMQFERVVNDLRVVNAGSVGMPFGNKTGANWLVLSQDIEFRHTAYDTVKAAERVRQSNYPSAHDFAINNILRTPTEADALAMLTRLEAKQHNDE